ncbi:MAG: DUF4139 domain-containing protein [Planctomycetota bacterium]
MPALTLSSKVIRAAVYARGAEVTRRVELTPEAAGALELELPGVSAHAAPGSFRAHAHGAVVRGVRSRLTAAPAGDPLALQAALDAARQVLTSLQAEASWLRERRQRLESIAPRAQLHESEAGSEARPTRSPEARLADALAVQRLRRSLIEGVDAELDAVEARERDQARAVQRLIDQQGAGPPRTHTRAVTVELEPDGALESLELTYVVPTARWWPAYAVRLGAAGQTARWQLEAFVAQLSGEDWEGVELSLATSDLISDASFPDLPAQRLGRRRDAKRAFRAPPEGLDALFAGFDRDRARLQSAAQRDLPPFGAARDARGSITASFPASSLADSDSRLGGVEPAPDLDGAAYDVGADADDLLLDYEEHALPPPGAAPQPQPDVFASRTRGGLPSRSRSAPLKKRAKGEAFDAYGGGGGGDSSPLEPEWSAPEAWLDFDGLTLAGVHQAHRGRLRPRSLGADEAVAAQRVLDGLHPSGDPADPLTARGSFDHRFRAAAPADVKSGPEPQRVMLRELHAPVAQRLRAVPVVEERVYREVELINPVDAPLLAGPVEVFFEDAFLTQTRVDAVPRGGLLRIGLGEEERVRVVRRVTSKELTQGLLGGTTVVQHEVRFEVSSQLGVPIELELLARVPVPGEDQALEVGQVSSSPQSEAFPPSAQPQGLKGGRRFLVSLEPGGSAVCELRYSLSFSAKSEVEGGNVRA